jgi:hypothetical protein
MAKTTTKVTIDETVEIDLREPGWAAFLAWLWPGAGHLYQRRYAKGVLFMAGILAVYFFGLAIGRGHVVYASWTQDDKRWHYLCQVGVGLPALPALVQAHVVLKEHRKPLWKGFMAPPEQPVQPELEDELARWHAQLGSNFELGTLYTMIAGLLNILVVYDAFAGPFVGPPEKKDSDEPSDKPEGQDKS